MCLEEGKRPRIARVLHQERISRIQNGIEGSTEALLRSCRDGDVPIFILRAVSSELEVPEVLQELWVTWGRSVLQCLLDGFR